MKFDETILPQQFYDFYTELLRQKEFIRSEEGGSLQEVDQESDDLQAEELKSSRVQKELISLLEQQAIDSGSRGGEYGVAYYREGQYIMAALADEIFLNMDWEGREEWKANLIETKLFNSHAAGEIFYEKLDNLLKEKDSAFIGVAALFLLALALGFRGKYRDKDDGGLLDQYRHKLYVFIFNRNPDLLESSKLFPEAYAHTLYEGSGKQFPGLKIWLGLNIIILIILLVISNETWTRYTNEMMALVKKFIG